MKTKKYNKNTPIKDDKGKLLYNLFPVEVHEQIIQRFTYGAKKYGEDPDGIPNWRRGEGHKSYKLLNAAMRHIAEYRKGILNDEEGGDKSPHIICAITNLVMLQDLENIKMKRGISEIIGDLVKLADKAEKTANKYTKKKKIKNNK